MTMLKVIESMILQKKNVTISRDIIVINEDLKKYVTNPGKESEFVKIEVSETETKLE